MRLYRFPKWLRWIYPGAVWEFPEPHEKTIYLTFDDGPNPEITPYLLDLLDQYKAKATFFCLGQQVKKYPDLFQQLLDRGHQVGNHSMTHPNGWRTSTARYLKDVEEASTYIPGKLFRPPYGRITKRQAKALQQKGYTIIFWTVVSYDFNPDLRAKRFIRKMKRMTTSGSVFVFHDNPKALGVLKKELPQLMQYWKDKNYTFKKVHHE
ncbi:MAG: polysaccharide deacetylase family protein [Crocinitomicaceae bacterium]